MVVVVVEVVDWMTLTWMITVRIGCDIEMFQSKFHIILIRIPILPFENLNACTRIPPTQDTAVADDDAHYFVLVLAPDPVRPEMIPGLALTMVLLILPFLL